MSIPGTGLEPVTGHGCFHAPALGRVPQAISLKGGDALATSTHCPEREAEAESQSVQASRESEACGFSTSPAAWDTQGPDGPCPAPPREQGAAGRGAARHSQHRSGRLDPSAGLSRPQSSGCSRLGLLPTTPCPGVDSEPKPESRRHRRALGKRLPRPPAARPPLLPASSRHLVPVSAF